jgi:hypothetical protein
VTQSSNHITESQGPLTGLDCRLSIDLPPRCSEARLLRIIGVGIDAFEKLSGIKRRQWPMATQIEPTRKPRRQHKPRIRPPDGLRTPAEAAAKLGCSIKTLDGYVSNGTLRYVALGHGKKRQRKMFADADLDEFIANQTRKDVPCPSTRTRTVARRISTSTSKCEVIGFTALQRRRTSAKPKK